MGRRVNKMPTIAEGDRVRRLPDGATGTADRVVGQLVRVAWDDAVVDTSWVRKENLSTEE